MPNSKTIQIKNIHAIVYDFALGEKLAEHVHDETTEHMTFISRGSFVIRQPDEEDIVATAGDVFYFPAGRLHEIEAIEDKSRLVNQLTKGA